MAEGRGCGMGGKSGLGEKELKRGRRGGGKKDLAGGESERRKRDVGEQANGQRVFVMTLGVE